MIKRFTRLVGIVIWRQESSSKLSSSSSKSFEERPAKRGNRGMPTTPADLDTSGSTSGSTQHVSLPSFTSNVLPPGRLELKGKLSGNCKKWK